MKNYKLIIYSLIASAVLYLGFEITGVKINFGSAWWQDTLSNRITTNKAINLRPGDSLYYNGNVVTSGTESGGDVYLSNNQVFTGNNYYDNGTYFADCVKVHRAIFLADSVKVTYRMSVADSINTSSIVGDALFLRGYGGAIYWRGYNSNIAEGLNVLDYTSGSHNFNGNVTFNDDIEPQWVKNHSPHNELAYTKEKILKFKAPAANSTTTVAHGVTDWHSIVLYQVTIKDDTTNVAVHEGGWYTPLVFYTKADTTNITVTIPSTSYSIANDSGYIYIKYVDPNR